MLASEVLAWLTGHCWPLPQPSQLAAPFSRSLRAESDGWVNWSGLATLLANFERAFAEKVMRFVLTPRCWAVRYVAPRIAG